MTLPHRRALPAADRDADRTASPTRPGEPTLRRTPRPGDPGRIIAHHGVVYSAEFGLDSSFEGHVAASVAAATAGGWPGPGEAIMIVEHEGEHAGSLGLTDDGGGVATLRWFVLDPALRGRGLGRRMVTELLGEAREAGYERVRLETFSELRAAARIYRDAGFELVGSETGPRWGRRRVTYQSYELSFQRRAQSRSSPSTGRRVRPFSVSA